MVRYRQLLYPALGIAVLAGVYLLGTSRGESNALRALDARLAAIESKQRTFETGYLNGIGRPALAQQLGYQARERVGSQRAAGTDPVDRRPSPLASTRAAQDKLARIQHDFLAEPMNPAWASSTRQRIEDAMVVAGEESGVVANGMQADCRSRSCLLMLDLADSTEVDRLSESFLTEISDKLPVTSMIPVRGPDGRVQLTIFATMPPRGG